MALPRKKPVAAPASKQPQFRVVGKDEKPSGIKKLDLGALVKKTADKPSKHPIVEVDAEALQLLEQFVELNPQFKDLENQLKTIKAQVAPHIKATYFTRFAGTQPESSTMLVTAGGKTVKLIVKDRYSTKCADDGALVAAIGAPLVAQNFRQATVLKIELEKIADDKQEAFVERIMAAAQELGIADGISASQCIQPRAGFHQSRTTILTPDQNIAVDEYLPITAYPLL
jgi:hypothetical protein